MIAYDVRDGIAIVTVDNPPVNALGPGVLDGIAEAVARGVADPSVAAIVLVGAGRTFVAGADINVFRTLKTREQALARSGAMHARLRQIEDSPKPVVAAIHGTALGGGLELSMACHFRIATASAQVGQPEVHLGIIPGAGGTQRLPRLCGVPMALTMCTEGTPISAARALAAGIVDAVVADEHNLVEAALAFARARAGASDHVVRRTRDLGHALADTRACLAACAERRRALEASFRGNPAPLTVVDAIEGACRLPFDAGSLRERELAADRYVSRESRALVHLFFAEREAAKVPGVPRDTPAQTVACAAVVGAGQAAAGIAKMYADAGIRVLSKDGNTGFDDLKTADIAVECVAEELKKSTFRALGSATAPTCVLVSTTTSSDIDELAGASGRASSVVAYHFVGPAHLTKLVEIVRGKYTSAEAIATSLKLAKRLGKVAVVAGNQPGVLSRLLDAFTRSMSRAIALSDTDVHQAMVDEVLTTQAASALATEGARLLRDGVAARPGDIDIACCYAFGYPRHLGGPLWYADTVGLAHEGGAFYDDLR